MKAYPRRYEDLNPFRVFALGDEVQSCFVLSLAEGAPPVILPTSGRKPVRGTNHVLYDKPSVEFAFFRRPDLSDQRVKGCVRRANALCFVGR